MVLHMIRFLNLHFRSSFKKFIFAFLAVPFFIFCSLAHAQFDSSLPICPAGEYESLGYPSQTFTNYGGGPGEMQVSTDGANVTRSLLIGGLDGTGCANQNWAGLSGSDRSYPRAVIGYAEPNLIPINPLGANVTFKINGAGHSGPFDANMPECFPATDIENIEVGGCNYQSTVSLVAYRVANGAGTFDGPWTIAGAGTNSWFKFTRESDCPTGAPDVVHPSNGVPCSYRLEFFLSPEGTPTLQRSIQVVFFSSVARKESDGFYPRAASPISMVFYTGGSIDIELKVSNNRALKSASTRNSTSSQVNFIAQVTGDISTLGSTKIYLQSAPIDGGEWTTIASGDLDSSGQTLFNDVAVSDSLSYRAVFAETDTNASISSQPIALSSDQDPDPTEDPTNGDEDPKDTDDSNLSPNEQVLQSLGTVSGIINQIKKKISKKNKEEQLSLRTSLKELANEISDLLSNNVSSLVLSKKKFKVAKQTKKLKRALRKLASRKKKGYSKRKKRAKRTIKKFEKALAAG